ncbi:amidohydrolase family protein [Burkholderia ambifaria]|uniref:amidohydrolase family protein n=1 Tax=Burkholderia ambifaria TaxID=152480 RepID=UPI00158B08A1|nr:amidohydrolase family protein [Burkholderia ambifaria]
MRSQTPLGDADSHIMPTRAWLASYLRRKHRSLADLAIPDWDADLHRFEEQVAQQRARMGTRRQQLARALSGPKSLFAPGALDPATRSEVLDALGIDAQIIFSTFVAPRLSSAAWKADEIAAIVRAHNRGIADFCARDSRLIGVGAVSFHNAAHALAEARWLRRQGLRALLVPTDAFWHMRPSDPKLEPFWHFCAQEGMLVTTHIGGGTLLPEVYHGPDAGPQVHLRPKDFAVLHHTVERFLTCIVLDGVLDRHPQLRVGVMEQGAFWLAGFMRHLDHAVQHFRKDTKIRRLKRMPSEVIRMQVKATPFFFEDVGALIGELDDDRMLLFSTDYPHFEGGLDPVGAFRRHLARHRLMSASGDRFFGNNLRELLMP